MFLRGSLEFVVPSLLYMHFVRDPYTTRHSDHALAVKYLAF